MWGQFTHMNCGKSRSRCNCKAVFIRYRHQLLLLLDEVDMLSRTQIRHYTTFFLNFTKWPPVAFKINTQSFKINTQLLISLKFFHKMADAILDDRKITFDHFSRHFRSICNFFSNCFYKMTTGDHFK